MILPLIILLFIVWFTVFWPKLYERLSDAFDFSYPRMLERHLIVEIPLSIPSPLRDCASPETFWTEMPGAFASAPASFDAF